MGSFQRMLNPHVLYSMCLFCVSHLAIAAIAGRAFEVLSQGDLKSFQLMMKLGCIFYIVMMGSMTYHSSTRTFLILTPRATRPWLVPVLVTLGQLACHSVAGYYWYINFIDETHYYQNYLTNMFVMVYVCASEGTMFALCQYKIVTTLTGTGTSRGRLATLWFPYIKASLRCVGFFSTVALQMLTLTNSVFAETSAWSFITYNPVLLSMIMLTDAARIQDLIERMDVNFQEQVKENYCLDAEEASTKSAKSANCKLKRTASLASG
ncbi:hypothetical protein HK101_004626 [Irineochytrium annulatum]|nr:hypothetical protein HK101_004626 [Irineochytrium annulatum]